MLRKAAVRSLNALWNADGALLDRFTAQECLNYFANSGYPSPKRNLL